MKIVSYNFIDAILCQCNVLATYFIHLCITSIASIPLSGYDYSQAHTYLYI